MEGVEVILQRRVAMKPRLFLDFNWHVNEAMSASLFMARGKSTAKRSASDSFFWNTKRLMLTEELPLLLSGQKWCMAGQTLPKFFWWLLVSACTLKNYTRKTNKNNTMLNTFQCRRCLSFHQKQNFNMLRTDAFGKRMLLRNGQARMTWCRAYSERGLHWQDKGLSTAAFQSFKSPHHSYCSLCIKAPSAVIHSSLPCSNVRYVHNPMLWNNHLWV